MQVEGASAVVTGGASGLGLAVATRLEAAGASVVIADLVPPADAAEHVFVSTDITDPDQVDRMLERAGDLGPLRILVHCAGRGGGLRLVGRDGEPGPLEDFEQIVRTNLVGTFNVLRLAAARIARSSPIDGERGVCVLTASIAAYEGQAGQIAYASSKAGIVGMTLVAARDLAAHQIRVCSIAPGPFDTPMLGRLPEDRRAALAAAVPHPSRLGRPDDFASLALQIVENPMLNGETIRLDGALRMAAR